MRFMTTSELEAELPTIEAAPADDGELVMVVRRPGVDGREVLDEGELSLDEGLVGDSWNQRPSRRSADGGPHPDMQLNIMNARVLRFIADNDPERMAQAGDQLMVDLDLSDDNLPPGTRLAIGDGGAVVEVTDQPHNGCPKFKARFGAEALRFVNAKEHRHLHMRGINAKVAVPGTIRPGDRIRRLPAD